MKKVFVIIVFCAFSCDKPSQEHICMDYQINIEALELEVEKLFQENGRLKEQLENCKEYLKSFESNSK